jgi:hypothetical protein
MNHFLRATFVKLLIGKSICEGLLVTALASGLVFTTTNHAMHGWLEQADSQTISGWAVDESDPGRRVEVQLFIDGNFIEQQTADESRADGDQAKGAAGNRRGFVFKTPLLSAGEHEATVYVVHRASPATRTLQAIGNPIRFRTLP